ncbi:MAG: hypothetical protein ABSC06_17185 [Rhodopila sp.]|jgi:hypothetical protein
MRTSEPRFKLLEWQLAVAALTAKPEDEQIAAVKALAGRLGGLSVMTCCGQGADAHGHYRASCPQYVSSQMGRSR